MIELQLGTWQDLEQWSWILRYNNEMTAQRMVVDRGHATWS
jgi:hypothetical protein